MLVGRLARRLQVNPSNRGCIPTRECFTHDVINPIVYTVIGCDEANVMPRTRQIDGSTYGINVIVRPIPQMLKSSFDSTYVACGTRTFTNSNTAGRQCPWTSCYVCRLKCRPIPVHSCQLYCFRR